MDEEPKENVETVEVAEFVEVVVVVVNVFPPVIFSKEKKDGKEDGGLLTEKTLFSLEVSIELEDKVEITPNKLTDGLGGRPKENVGAVEEVVVVIEEIIGVIREVVFGIVEFVSPIVFSEKSGKSVGWMKEPLFSFVVSVEDKNDEFPPNKLTDGLDEPKINGGIEAVVVVIIDEIVVVEVISPFVFWVVKGGNVENWLAEVVENNCFFNISSEEVSAERLSDFLGAKTEVESVVFGKVDRLSEPKEVIDVDNVGNIEEVDVERIFVKLLTLEISEKPPNKAGLDEPKIDGTVEVIGVVEVVIEVVEAIKAVIVVKVVSDDVFPAEVGIGEDFNWLPKVWSGFGEVEISDSTGEEYIVSKARRCLK